MAVLLKNKQILALFISSFAVMFTGFGLFPILPLYAAQFEATNSTTGFYLAAIYAANALGPVAAGWLTTRFSRRKIFIAGALTGFPALLGMATARNFEQAILFTSLLWFSGGLVMALVSIFTGLSAGESDRGKAFSLMALVGPMGALAGGAAVGQLIAWGGYSGMLLVLAATWTIVPLIGWRMLKEDKSEKPRPAVARGQAQAVPGGLGANFARVVAIAFFGSIAVSVARFGSSLSMQAQQFTPEAVSTVAMISGLVAIPATYMIGVISDRIGSKHLLFASYMLAMSGSLILAGASSMWQFGLAAILHLLAFSTSGAMAQAITAEVVPSRSVSKGLSYLNTLIAVSNILCFAAGGVLYDLLGMPLVFLGAAVLALVSGAGIETLTGVKRAAATAGVGAD